MFIPSCTNYSSASVSRGSKIDTFAICGVYQKKPNINASDIYISRKHIACLHPNKKQKKIVDYYL